MKLSKEDYLIELNDIGAKLEDFIKQIQLGKETYFKDLSLKLRILYCDKSGTKALIKIIQDLFKLEIRVSVNLSMTEKVKKGLLPVSLLDRLAIEQLNSVIRWFEPRGELTPIIDAINKKDEVLINDRNYSYKEIFESIADKMGGAHIDSTIPEEVLILHSNNLRIGGLSIAHRATFDTAMASIKLIKLINELLKENKESDFIKKIN